MSTPVSRTPGSTLAVRAFVVVPAMAILISATLAQAPKQKEAEPAPKLPWQRLLQGDDAKRAAELDKAIEAALKADQWAEAIARVDELLAFRLRVQGPEHFETVNDEWRAKTLRLVSRMPHEDRVAYLSADTQNEQAKRVYYHGKYVEAQPLFEQVLETRRRLLTDEHPQTAEVYDRLALNLRSLPIDYVRRTAEKYENLKINLDMPGAYAPFQPLFQKAHDISRRLLTDDHPQTAECYNSVAGNLEGQGMYDQAQPLYEKALAIRIRLRPDDYYTAVSWNNLAANLNAQGKYAAAQGRFEKALESFRRLLTDNHADTAMCYSNLAANVDAQVKYAEAEPYHRKAVEFFTRRLPNHATTANVYNNAAANLDFQGKQADAEPLYKKALEINRQLFTDDHAITANSYHSLAMNFLDQGKYAEAGPLCEKALEIRRHITIGEDAAIANSYNTLAAILKAQGKYAEAQPLYEEALRIRRGVLGENHHDTAASYNNVGANLDAQGEHGRAQPKLEEALAIFHRTLPDDHPDTVTAYNNLTFNLHAQGKYDLAQPRFEKVLALRRRVLSDDHPVTATSYHDLAINLASQGKYAAAQRYFEKSLEIKLSLLADGHPLVASSYSALAYSLASQGKYAEARDQWLNAVKSLDKGRLRIAFAGLERSGTEESPRPALAAVLARLGQPADAWQTLEEDLGRGLLDELAARKDQRLTRAERDQLRELTTTLDRLERLVATTPEGLDQVERSKRFEDFKHRHEVASIDLGKLQTKLARKYGELAGPVAGLGEIQAALPEDAALVAWVDIPPVEPNAADPDGEHWGVVVRSRGVPTWVPIAGTDPKGLWSKVDWELAKEVQTGLGIWPDDGPAALRPLIERLRAQRIEPLAKALGATDDGLRAARSLIVLPSVAMAGIPVEALLADDDTRVVSYAPSATVFKYLRERPRPERRGGLLAVGDPVFKQRTIKPIDPQPPDHGLVINMVIPDSSAAAIGLKPGDVLLSYNGIALVKREDLKAVQEPGGPVAVDVWRGGKVKRVEVARGKLGVVVDTRASAVAIVEERKLSQALAAARSDAEDFPALPYARREIDTLAELFRADDPPPHILVGAAATELELDRLAASGKLGRFGVIHLATHAVIDKDIPARSAVILTQTGLPDPLQQTLNNKPVFDGRLSVREIQRGWDLNAELVTFSACKTALGRESGGEGFVGFTQALLISGARSVCLSLWPVGDQATSLLMKRFYQNWLGKRADLDRRFTKAEALREAKQWLRRLSADQVQHELDQIARDQKPDKHNVVRPTAHPYEHPYFWAGFILVGDPS